MCWDEWRGGGIKAMRICPTGLQPSLLTSVSFASLAWKVFGDIATAAHKGCTYVTNVKPRGRRLLEVNTTSMVEPVTGAAMEASGEVVRSAAGSDLLSNVAQGTLQHNGELTVPTAPKQESVVTTASSSESVAAPRQHHHTLWSDNFQDIRYMIMTSLQVI